jgi:hypothetical protein
MKIFSVYMFCLLAVLSSCSNEDVGNDVTGTQSGNFLNPNVPYDPTPDDSSTSMDRMIELSWRGADPNEFDTVRYDVYFGTSQFPNILVSYNLLDSSYSAGLGAANTTYYWRIVAKDNHGLYTDGPIWRFTTGN